MELYSIVLYSRFDSSHKIVAVTLSRDLAEEIIAKCSPDLNDDQTLEAESLDHLIFRSSNRIIGFSPVEKDFILKGHGRE